MTKPGPGVKRQTSIAGAFDAIISATYGHGARPVGIAAEQARGPAEPARSRPFSGKLWVGKGIMSPYLLC